MQRRAEFDLRKANKRLHLVDGFLAAMENLDAVVSTIRGASDSDEAVEQLQSVFTLSQEQAEGVLGLTLRRLTSMEKNKLAEEQGSLRAR